MKFKLKSNANLFPDIPDPLGHGQRAVEYIRSLKHPLSTLPGNAYPLDPWAEQIIRKIYGPRHPDGTRVVKQVLVLVPRGNRKTTLTAAITLLHGRGPERRPGGQIVSVAVDKKQAKGVFKEVAGMIDGDYAFAAKGHRQRRKGHRRQARGEDSRLRLEDHVRRRHRI